MVPIPFNRWLDASLGAGDSKCSIAGSKSGKIVTTASLFLKHSDTRLVVSSSVTGMGLGFCLCATWLEDFWECADMMDLGGQGQEPEKQDPRDRKIVIVIENIWKYVISFFV